MMSVGDLMTSEVHTLHPDDTLVAAREMMQTKKIRHIPIVEENCKFVGLISHRDVLAHTISSLAGIDESTRQEIDSLIPVGEIMRTDVKSTAPQATVREAAQTLLTHKYGCLPVLQDGRLKGILTEADFLKLTISLIDELQKSSAM